jgi:hypothetical protein
MTQNTNAATTSDVYAAIGQNRNAHRITNRIFAAAASRPGRVAGRSYTTARNVEQAANREAKVNAAIITFVKVVRAAKTDARVETACNTLRRRAGLLDSNTLPCDLAEAIRATQ